MSEPVPPRPGFMFPYYTWEDQLFGGHNVYHAPMIFFGNFPTHDEAVDHMEACLAECVCHLCEDARKRGNDG